MSGNWLEARTLQALATGPMTAYNPAKHRAPFGKPRMRLDVLARHRAEPSARTLGLWKIADPARVDDVWNDVREVS